MPLIQSARIGQPSPRAATTAIFAALAALATLAASPAWAQTLASEQPGLRLTGQAEIETAPDMAVFSTGVVTQSKTAAQALADNTSAMTKLTEKLKSSGIAPADLQTSNFSVQPLYSYPRPPAPGESTPPPKLTGYQVSNDLTVKIRDLAKLGVLLDEVVTAGANRIQNLSFTLSNNDAVMDKARREAIADAKRKAETYADAAQVCLGPITSIAEIGGQMPVPMQFEARAMADSAPVPIQSGRVGVNVQVSVSWSIAPQPCAQN